MARKKRSRGFSGTESEHAGDARENVKNIQSLLKEGRKRLKEGSCRVAVSRMNDAYRELGMYAVSRSYAADRLLTRTNSTVDNFAKRVYRACLTKGKRGKW